MNGYAFHAPAAKPSRHQVPAATCNCAALEELLDYLNSHLPLLGGSQLERYFSAQAGRLVQRGNRIEAEVGPFVLRSEHRRIVPVTAPSTTLAWRRVLRAVTRSGREVSADALLRLQPGEAAATAMDRLLRTLHMLNHLACATSTQDLWVHTSLRHVLAVEHGHGEFFEDLLRRCGLGADRIVLMGALLPPADPDFARLVAAYAGYVSRGFRIALELPTFPSADALASLSLIDASWLRVSQQDIEALRARGVRLPLLIKAPGRPAAGGRLCPHDLLEVADYPVFLP